MHPSVATSSSASGTVDIYRSKTPDAMVSPSGTVRAATVATHSLLSPTTLQSVAKNRSSFPAEDNWPPRKPLSDVDDEEEAEGAAQATSKSAQVVAMSCHFGQTSSSSPKRHDESDDLRQFQWSPKKVNALVSSASPFGLSPSKTQSQSMQHSQGTKNRPWPPPRIKPSLDPTQNSVTSSPSTSDSGRYSEKGGNNNSDVGSSNDKNLTQASVAEIDKLRRNATSGVRGYHSPKSQQSNSLNTQQRRSSMPSKMPSPSKMISPTPKKSRTKQPRKVASSKATTPLSHGKLKLQWPLSLDENNSPRNEPHHSLSPLTSPTTLNRLKVQWPSTVDDSLSPSRVNKSQPSAPPAKLKAQWPPAPEHACSKKSTLPSVKVSVKSRRISFEPGGPGQYRRPLSDGARRGKVNVDFSKLVLDSLEQDDDAEDESSNIEENVKAAVQQMPACSDETSTNPPANEHMNPLEKSRKLTAKGPNKSKSFPNEGLTDSPTERRSKADDRASLASEQIPESENALYPRPGDIESKTQPQNAHRDNSERSSDDDDGKSKPVDEPGQSESEKERDDHLYFLSLMRKGQKLKPGSAKIYKKSHKRKKRTSYRVRYDGPSTLFRLEDEHGLLPVPETDDRFDKGPSEQTLARPSRRSSCLGEPAPVSGTKGLASSSDSAPSHPLRRNSDDMSDDEDYDSNKDEDEEENEQNRANAQKVRPHVWITPVEGGEEMWLVKRVWYLGEADESEREHSVENCKLMGTLKVLLGVPNTASKTPAAGSTPGKIPGLGCFRKSNNNKNKNNNVPISSALWHIKRFIDVDGEPEETSVEYSLDEKDLNVQIQILSTAVDTNQIEALDGDAGKLHAFVQRDIWNGSNPRSPFGAWRIEEWKVNDGAGRKIKDWNRCDEVGPATGIVSRQIQTFDSRDIDKGGDDKCADNKDNKQSSALFFTSPSIPRKCKLKHEWVVSDIERCATPIVGLTPVHESENDTTFNNSVERFDDDSNILDSSETQIQERGAEQSFVSSSAPMRKEGEVAGDYNGDVVPSEDFAEGHGGESDENDTEANNNEMESKIAARCGDVSPTAPVRWQVTREWTASRNDGADDHSGKGNGDTHGESHYENRGLHYGGDLSPTAPMRWRVTKDWAAGDASADSSLKGGNPPDSSSWNNNDHDDQVRQSMHTKNTTQSASSVPAMSPVSKVKADGKLRGKACDTGSTSGEGDDSNEKNEEQRHAAVATRASSAVAQWGWNEMRHAGDDHGGGASGNSHSRERDSAKDRFKSGSTDPSDPSTFLSPPSSTSKHTVREYKKDHSMTESCSNLQSTGLVKDGERRIDVDNMHEKSTHSDDTSPGSCIAPYITDQSSLEDVDGTRDSNISSRERESVQNVGDSNRIQNSIRNNQVTVSYVDGVHGISGSRDVPVTSSRNVCQDEKFIQSVEVSPTSTPTSIETIEVSPTLSASSTRSFDLDWKENSEARRRQDKEVVPESISATRRRRGDDEGIDARANSSDLNFSALDRVMGYGHSSDRAIPDHGTGDSDSSDALRNESWDTSREGETTDMLSLRPPLWEPSDREKRWSDTSLPSIDHIDHLDHHNMRPPTVCSEDRWSSPVITRGAAGRRSVDSKLISPQRRRSTTRKKAAPKQYLIRTKKNEPKSPVKLFWQK